MKTFALLSLFVVSALHAATPSTSTPPSVGDTAPNFTLRTLDDTPVELAKLTAEKPVVLVVLRGWPGYQCPLCTKQVHDFVARAGEFRERGALVVMVYPGPADDLRAHAQEFLADKSWPAEFRFGLDPDYTFTRAYGLRWDAKSETAHPATFIVARDGRVAFAHVSRTHGDRVGAARALAALASVLPIRAP